MFSTQKKKSSDILRKRLRKSRKMESWDEMFIREQIKITNTNCVSNENLRCMSGSMSVRPQYQGQRCYTWYILRLLSAVSENITGEAKYMLFWTRLPCQMSLYSLVEVFIRVKNVLVRFQEEGDALMSWWVYRPQASSSLQFKNNR